MTKQQLDAVKDAIPLSCKIVHKGMEFDGIINGRRLDYPVVHFGCRGENDLRKVEISWALAYRVMTGQCRQIIAG